MAYFKQYGLFLACEGIRILDRTVLASHAIVDNFPGFYSVAFSLHA